MTVFVAQKARAKGCIVVGFGLSWELSKCCKCKASTYLKQVCTRGVLASLNLPCILPDVPFEVPPGQLDFLTTSAFAARVLGSVFFVGVHQIFWKFCTHVHPMIGVSKWRCSRCRRTPANTNQLQKNALLLI